MGQPDVAIQVAVDFIGFLDCFALLAMTILAASSSFSLPGNPAPFAAGGVCLLAFRRRAAITIMRKLR